MPDFGMWQELKGLCTKWVFAFVDVKLLWSCYSMIENPPLRPSTHWKNASAAEPLNSFSAFEHERGHPTQGITRSQWLHDTSGTYKSKNPFSAETLQARTTNRMTMEMRRLEWHWIWYRQALYSSGCGFTRAISPAWAMRGREGHKETVPRLSQHNYISQLCHHTPHSIIIKYSELLKVKFNYSINLLFWIKFCIKVVCSHDNFSTGSQFSHISNSTTTNTSICDHLCHFKPSDQKVTFFTQSYRIFLCSFTCSKYGHFQAIR